MLFLHYIDGIYLSKILLIIIIIIMEGSYKAHNLQKNSERTNNKDKQTTSVNPEKPDEKDEFQAAP